MDSPRHRGKRCSAVQGAGDGSVPLYQSAGGQEREVGCGADCGEDAGVPVAGAGVGGEL